MMKLPKLLDLTKPKRRASLNTRSARPGVKDEAAPAGMSLHWAHVGLTVITIILLSALMSVNLMPDRISLRKGDISSREVRASRTVIFVNTSKTALNEQAARLATRPVYDSDDRALANAVRIVHEFFDRVGDERTLAHRHSPSRSADIEQALVRLQGSYNSFSRAQLQSLLTLSPGLLQKMRDIAVSRVRMAMMMDIHDRYDQNRPSNDLAHAQEDVTDAARAALSSENAALVTDVARLALRPNLLYNAQKTELAREANARQVPPVYEQISPGDKIIGVGEKVTQEHVDKFTALGLLNPHIAIETGVGVCVLAAVMVVLVVYFIAQTLPKLYQDTRRLTLLAVIVLISVFGLKVGGTLLGLSFSSGQGGYLGMMTVVAAGMLVSVLLDMQLAVLIVALLAVQSGLIMNHEIRFTVMTLMSSLVGIFAAGNTRRKNNLPTITLALAVANLALVWLTGMIQRDTLPELLTGSIWAVGAAAFATFLYWFGILALESPFGILTHTTLLEMSAADRPLLRQLCTVAPGTYAHSMMVGTLAEAGAQAIGADALLCRVGGYYHDIGKMRRPDFFIENQRNGNVHGRLSPSLSALIVTAHVRDGLEIAREHRLPNEIQDIVAEHHGTTLIRYFYHQALMDCGGTDEAPPGLEERFRYPGPKPQGREAAIVMIADSVEAAARCLKEPTREALAGLIHGIIRDKMEDGQFDECRLTFHEVKLITEAFLHVLTAMMHARIDYPVNFPKTASGRPMDLVRADIRPENAPSLAEANGPPETANGSHSGQVRDDTASIGTPSLAEAESGGLSTADPMGAVGLDESLLGVAETQPDGATNSGPMPPYKSPARPLVAAEVRYANLSEERTETLGPHNAAETSLPTASLRRKFADRPGGYPPDG